MVANVKGDRRINRKRRSRRVRREKSHALNKGKREKNMREEMGMRESIIFYAWFLLTSISSDDYDICINLS